MKFEFGSESTSPLCVTIVRKMLACFLPIPIDFLAIPISIPKFTSLITSITVCGGCHGDNIHLTCKTPIYRTQMLLNSLSTSLPLTPFLPSPPSPYSLHPSLPPSFDLPPLPLSSSVHLVVLSSIFPASQPREAVQSVFVFAGEMKQF